MKAMVQGIRGAPDDLELRDVGMPGIGDDEVLIQVRSAGVGTGFRHLTGLTRGLRAPKVRVRGRDVAGRVEAAGRNVTRFQPGAEVFGFCGGSFAEYAVARADKVAPKPWNLTFEQAATIPISGSAALQGLRDAGRVQPGQQVLITGAAGGVGTFAVQLAKMLGAEVTGVCGATTMDFVRSIGADDVVDDSRADFADRSRRYDLILDAEGNRPLSNLRRALTEKGTLVIVGGEGGRGWLDRSLRALVLSPFVSQTLRGLVSKETGADLRILGEYVESGKLVPVIDRTYSLDDAAKAVRYVEDGHARGKVVINL